LTTIATRDAEAASARGGLVVDGLRDPPERANGRIASGARSGAVVVGARQTLVAVASALTVLTVARCLGPRSFGLLAGGAAVFWLGLGLADGGLSVLLVRELAARPQDEERVTAVALRAQAAWCLALAAALALLAATATGARGLVMFALVPALALGGASVTRQIVAVRNRSSRLIVVDACVFALQAATTVGLALGHVPVWAIAANLSVWTCLSAAPAYLVARSYVRLVELKRTESLRFLRTAAPAGLAPMLPAVTLLLQLALLGWLLSPAAVGRYAASFQLLLFATAVPGVMLATRSRTLLRPGRNAGELARGAATLTRVFAVVGIPVAALIALLARPLVRTLLGAAYSGAVPVVPVLMVAAVLSVAATISAILAVSLGQIRRLLIAGAVAAIGGAACLIALAPSRGPIVAAWVAVASQGIVLAGALASLHGELGLREVLRQILGTSAAASVPERDRGASALVAASALAGSIPGIQAAPSYGSAAAAMALGGRVPMRPQIGEGRRAAADPRGRERTALLLASAVVVALLAIAAANLKDLPATPASPAPPAVLARAGGLQLRYARPWRPVSTAVAGSSAFVSSGGSPGAIALSSGTATLAAGTLAQSASFPGGVPPVLVQTLGKPMGAGDVTLSGHRVSSYSWEVSGGERWAVFVLPTDGADLAIVCAGRLESSLRACDQLALTTRVSGVGFVAPGPFTAVSTAVQRALAPALTARSELGGLTEVPLSRRAAPASAAAAADDAAAAVIAKLAAPGRVRSVVAAVIAALRHEGAALSSLATVATSTRPAGYAAASGAVELASAALARAVAQVRAQALSAPPFPALTLAAAPAVTPTRPAAPRHAHATHRLRAATKRGRATTTARPSAPVTQRTAPVVSTPAPVVRSTAPVVRSTAPVVRSTAPVVRTPAPVHSAPQPVRSKPVQHTSTHPATHPAAAPHTTPAPTTVVVPVSPTGSSKHSGSGKTVVVPVG
jgi:O-antigen/teichoic acid export membrane protein